MAKTKKYGLIGKNISYSFSKNYFLKKFDKLQLDNCTYENFDLASIDEFPLILDKNINLIKGLNVTIPYKQDIFKYLDEIDKDAELIGAVNTVKIIDNQRLKGFNTDVYGFKNSLTPLLQKHMKKALVLGTGGASKAVAFVLKSLNIDFLFVSRRPENDISISYEVLDKSILNKYQILINCTPLGTFPDVENYPDLPYKELTHKHLLFDLIYNPKHSSFLKKGMQYGAQIKNGQEMLELQADRSWEIWNS